jgi:hypothetical protein
MLPEFPHLLIIVIKLGKKFMSPEFIKVPESSLNLWSLKQYPAATVLQVSPSQNIILLWELKYFSFVSKGFFSHVILSNGYWRRLPRG